MTSPPRVSLPMYDHPAIRTATDAFWRALRRGLVAHGVDAPVALERCDDYAAIWFDPGLLLSQTCGFPYATRLRGRVRLVATPCYDAPGCEGPFYRSAIVVRADEPATELVQMRGKVLAVNAADSQSGHNALRAAAAPWSRPGAPLLGPGVETGGHAASARAVAEGRADLAAIDAVTFALIARHEPELAARLRVLTESPPAPGLPYVTSAETPEETVVALRTVLADVIADPDLADVRAALLITGAEVLPDEAYDAVLGMREVADAAGQTPIVSA